MTHQQKLQAVTEAIRKACPDINKLQVGSLVRALLCKDGEPIDDYNMDLFVISPEDTWEEVNNSIYIKHCNQEFFFYAILGQPIGICSVLRALHKEDNFQDRSTLSPDMSIFIDDLVNQYWNLEKDTLDQQEEPVIDLLHSILCHDNNNKT